MIDLGEIAGLAPTPLAFQGPFDFHSIAFEVTADGPYRFEIQDLNTGPGSFAGVISTNVMDVLGLEINAGDDLTGPALGAGGFNQPASSSAVFTTQLEAGQRYVGLLAGFVADGAQMGEASLSISLVPIPPAAVLLLSAVGGLLVVRRRKGGKTPTA